MEINNLHKWNMPIKKAIELQKSFAGQVKVQRFNKKLKTKDSLLSQVDNRLFCFLGENFINRSIGYDQQQYIFKDWG